jgi:hypothetical protein
MKSLCFALILVLSTTPACSHYSAPKRRERAYASYMKKMRANRDRRLARLRRSEARPLQQTPPELEPRETTQMPEGPQAVPREPENQ